MKRAIQIDEIDNVATVTSDIITGETVEVVSPKGVIILRATALDAIPFGHKIALTNLEKAGQVIKYGGTIGLASTSIRIGAWVHTHNVESAVVPTSRFRGTNA